MDINCSFAIEVFQYLELCSLSIMLSMSVAPAFFFEDLLLEVVPTVFAWTEYYCCSDMEGDMEENIDAAIFG